jgi:MinD-like ATPase involved in chromosome partitioning or flagellar assembly
MESGEPEAGKVITFYSYKGGTGRSMAVANVACLMGRESAKSLRRVLVMDWDLEAPGLHKYFATRSAAVAGENRPGVIDFFQSLHRALEEDGKLYKSLSAGADFELLRKVIPLEEFVYRDVLPGVDFIKAGRSGPDYAGNVNSFQWAKFYDKYGQVFNALRLWLTSVYDYCLIDSRTGLTDVGGVCTKLLPEKLVAVFTPNWQSVEGLLDVVREAVEYRLAADDFRPLTVFPVPSRIELAEMNLRKKWRGDYQRAFEELFRKVYGVEDCDTTAYFDEVQIPHVSYYAYGEEIAVVEERSEALSLSRAYQTFYERLVGLDFPWERAETQPKPTTPTTRPHEQIYDAYVSYSRADELSADKLVMILEAHGLKVFFDKRDILLGQQIFEALERAVESSKSIIVLVGAKSANGWRQEEWSTFTRSAINNPQKRLIPILLPGASLEDVPSIFRHYNFLDLRDGLEDAGKIDLLIRSIMASA